MDTKTILCIDDDAQVCKTISSFLEMKGYAVQCAFNGTDGIDLYRKTKPDLVISDLRMGSMSGFDVMEHVHAENPGLPFILITAYGELDNAVNALRKGAWDFFTKPLADLELFGHAVDRCLERAALIREVDEYRRDLESLVRDRTQELERSEEKFRTIYENAMVGMITINLENGRVSDCNELGYTIFGYDSPEAFIGCHFSEFFTADEIEELEFLADLRGKQEVHSREMEMRRHNGRTFWAEITARLFLDEKLLDLVVVDVTRKKYAEQRIHELMYYDPLTKLANKEMLKNGLLTEISKGNRFAVMCVGLDNFKAVNEMFGPAIGDLLLCEIADRLSTNFFQKDLVARLEGDKFMVQFSKIGTAEKGGTLEDIEKIVQKTHRMFHEPFVINHERFHITPSIGICLYPNDGADPETLIKNSESAMYMAKEKGKNRSVFYNAHLNEEMMGRLRLERELRMAIENDEFLAYFQPMVGANGVIIGMESLIRWRSSQQQRLIPPLEFIPIAEKNGLIVDIGYHILKKACEHNKRWQDMGLIPVRVSVNLSPYQFSQNDIIANIKRLVEETGLDPCWLELEITESGILVNEKESIGKLREIHDIGISISIDDFGTGYSSLSKLKDYPIDTLKIDKSFVEDIPQNKASATLATTIINLAHNLGFEVVAEGVETKDQLDFLIAQGCDRFQGFYFSKPLPSDQFEENLKRLCN